MRGAIWKMVWVLAAFVVGGSAQAAGYYDNGYYGSNGYGYGDRQTFSCESRDQRTVYCNVDTRYGVSLYRQLSSSPCIEGRSWGQSGRGVWVSDGCRAQFVVGYDNRNYGYGDNGYYGGNGYGYGGNGYGYGGNGYGYGSGGSRTIRCESRSSRTVYCNIGYSSASVRLVRRLSQSACIEGSTWGRSRHGVWVSDGCRAEFRISSRYDNYSGNEYGYGSGYGNGYGYGYGYGNGYGSQRVVCESRDGRYNFCRTGSYVRQVQVYRQLSSSRCEYNYNWGYRSDGIWVDNGCRAEFLLY